MASQAYILIPNIGLSGNKTAEQLFALSRIKVDDIDAIFAAIRCRP